MNNYEVFFENPNVRKVIAATTLEQAKVLCQAERIHEGLNFAVTYAQELDIFVPMSESNRVFETEGLIVYHNECGEVFVRPKNGASATIRISNKNYYKELVVTCAEGRLTPDGVNGLPAFRASGR